MSESLAFTLKFDDDERNKRLITNVVIMLKNRKVYDVENIEDTVAKIMAQNPTDYVYTIKTNKDKYMVKIYDQKVTSINKTSNVGIFLRANTGNNILILESVYSKIEKEINTLYPNTELFAIDNLMMDIVSHVTVPKHELLTKEEVESFEGKFGIKKKFLPHILINDPIAKYYNAKPNDIFRIIRPSMVSGESVIYRIVVKGSAL